MMAVLQKALQPTKQNRARTRKKQKQTNKKTTQTQTQEPGTLLKTNKGKGGKRKRQRQVEDGESAGEATRDKAKQQLNQIRPSHCLTHLTVSPLNFLQDPKRATKKKKKKKQKQTFCSFCGLTIIGNVIATFHNPSSSARFGTLRQSIGVERGEQQRPPNMQLFDDMFTIKEMDPQGRKFERCVCACDFVRVCVFVVRVRVCAFVWRVRVCACLLCVCMCVSLKLCLGFNSGCRA